MTPIISLQSITTSAGRSVGVDRFAILPGQHWGVIGGNGSGKSTFAAMLSSASTLAEAQRHPELEKILTVSFEDEQKLLEREIYEDDSEALDKIDTGRTTHELISEHLVDSVDLDKIIDTMQLGDFLHTGFRLLSTGERRRMMIARALSQDP
ncbi:MAG: ATP-binding cassette domain-containing protein, partial [Verrucomicrobiae bacterium]|nr:ATP-binding cassette domain-containing protein [Verrucomicrobiae bacterium]NNJ87569.1 ATP-binding cassette domain-containing protein [Akkermansiaceae bacterium]